MSVNLVKNKDSLLAAWKEVVDENTATNWALFGYEGQSNDLRVVATGDGGIEQLAERLNSGKIMYAFCRVIDPKTSLPKCVMINWQGEGSPMVRKGTCANHVNDVGLFFKGWHITINARNEEEVDSQLIISKVARSTGSAYSFKERGDLDKQQTPVGSNYRRIVPKQEIDSKERDEFWEKERMEEKARQAEERKRKEEEEKRIKNLYLEQCSEAEAKARSDESKDITSGYCEDQILRSEELRRQRNEEAQSVISQRTINARAVFEQHTAAGQITNDRRSTISSPSLPLTPPASNPSSPVACNQSITAVVREEINDQQSEVAESYQHHVNDSQTEVQYSNYTTTDENNAQECETTEEQTVITEADWNSLPNLQARALYDYQAADPTEISFDPGDIISHIDQIDEGWWQGVGPEGVFGLFPANYVELIN